MSNHRPTLTTAELCTICAYAGKIFRSENVFAGEVSNSTKTSMARIHSKLRRVLELDTARESRRRKEIRLAKKKTKAQEGN